jgi:ABC-type dipeptide/oligopeptide/nickel transport system permease component
MCLHLAAFAAISVLAESWSALLRVFFDPIENVFFLPGLGRLVFQAIVQRDLIVVQSVVVVCVTFLVELGYAVVNPQLRVGQDV